MTSAHGRALLQIHFCVVLWGFTAILGKMISLPALNLVWWRMLLVSGTLLFLPRIWRAVAAMPLRLTAAYAGVGVIVALHWLTFYGAIKLANASVAATCIALAPVFVALVEPFITKRRFDARELLLGVAVVPGVGLVVGGVPEHMQLGLVLGVVSAFLVSIFGALNKRLAERADALTVTCLELGAGTIFLTAAAPFLAGEGAAFVIPTTQDALLLAALAYGCTLLPFALSLVALRSLSAFTAQLAVNLEPIYAIILAILLFDEQMELELGFYAGVAVVLAVVFVQPLLRARARDAAPDVAQAAESMALAEAPGDVSVRSEVSD